MTDTTEILVRIPGYVQAQIDRGDSLHPVPGFHRIVDTRLMQVVGRAGHRLHVIDDDGRLIQMDEAFYAAFARELPPVEPEDAPEPEPETETAPEPEAVEVVADAEKSAQISFSDGYPYQIGTDPAEAT